MTSCTHWWRALVSLSSNLRYGKVTPCHVVNAKMIDTSLTEFQIGLLKSTFRYEESPNEVTAARREMIIFPRPVLGSMHFVAAIT